MTSTNVGQVGDRPQSRAREIALSVVLWILQVLLAAAFLAHGWMMVSPPAELLDMINAQLGVGLRLFIGVAELLAAAGLILPGITRIMPILTVAAAAGLMIVMVCATVLHVSRGEIESAVSTLILLALLTAVLFLRWKVRPIPARWGI